MIQNTCCICGEIFTRPHNPNRVFKYCSTKCMGKDKNKAEKHSLKMTGKTSWNKGVKGMQAWMNTSGLKRAWNKGLKGIYSEETLEKNRQAHLGKPPPNKGVPDLKRRGEKSHLWRGGITPINYVIRHSIEYKQWRTEVFTRDNYTCVGCGERGGRLEAHHKKPFSKFTELRFDINNGETLCKNCHRKTDTYGLKLVRRMATGSEV